MSEPQINSDTIFLVWKSQIQEEYGPARFNSNNRRDAITMLIEMLYQNNIDYLEATFLENEVIEFLVTNEGKKGKGKYNNWTKAARSDFQTKLASVYYTKLAKTIQYDKPLKEKEQTVEQEVEDIAVELILQEDESQVIINEWGRFKYKNLWNDDLLYLATLVGSWVNVEFSNDLYNSLKNNNLEWLCDNNS